MFPNDVNVTIIVDDGMITVSKYFVNILDQKIKKMLLFGNIFLSPFHSRDPQSGWCTVLTLKINIS